MVHKAQFQMQADAAAMERGGFALHIGRIGDDTFVYSLRSARSADFDPASQTVITLREGPVTVCTVYEGEAAQTVLAETELREFGTGRAIFKKYQTLVKNRSAVIGEGPEYAQAIVDAVASKAVKPTLLYQYLEIADHYRKKLRISGSDIELYP